MYNKTQMTLRGKRALSNSTFSYVRHALSSRFQFVRIDWAEGPRKDVKKFLKSLSISMSASNLEVNQAASELIEGWTVTNSAVCTFEADVVALHNRPKYFSTQLRLMHSALTLDVSAIRFWKSLPDFPVQIESRYRQMFPKIVHAILELMLR